MPKVAEFNAAKPQDGRLNNSKKKKFFNKGRQNHVSDIFKRINNLYLLGEDSFNPLVSARVNNPQVNGQGYSIRV